MMEVVDMSSTVDWLKENKGIGDQAAREVGYSRSQLVDVILDDFSKADEYADAIYRVAASKGAPRDVSGELEDFVRMVKAGTSRVRNDGPFIQRTASAFKGIHSPEEVKLIIRGALPHAPNDDAKRSLDNLMKSMDTASERIESGGNLAWCLAGCVICGEGCLICCTIMLAD
ncbi:conserved hypothetical protein [Hyphomicrobiales bacterium]|nr:conserved hypothetical protein [Hyphomicrobiales bacterium]CAH1673343.1 conserved hypothetical protein [Hyphomicrobiales bacterium]